MRATVNTLVIAQTTWKVAWTLLLEAEEHKKLEPMAERLDKLARDMVAFDKEHNP